MEWKIRTSIVAGRWSSRRDAARGAASALLALLLVTACQTSSDLAQRVHDMIAAHNAHDIEGQLDLFTDDGRILLPDRSAIEGKADIRKLLEWDAALQHRYEFVDLEVRGDTVFADTGYEESDWHTGVGLGRVEHEPGTAIVFRGDRIAELRFAPLIRADRGRTREAIGDFARWAAEARPDLLETLLPGNEFVYSQDAAVTWLEALQLWREGTVPAY